MARLGAEALALVERGSRMAKLPRGAKVFVPGQVCDHYIIVCQGCIRVHLSDADGHSLTLYRLNPGDSCILTTSALLSGEPYAAYATTETEVSATLLRVDAFQQLLAISSEFRQTVFSDHGRRIMDLIGVVGNLAFESIDHRLAAKLTERAGSESRLALTHEALAFELGTAREVVSRRLKEFERRGWLKLGKGSIHILKLASLSDCAKR